MLVGFDTEKGAGTSLVRQVICYTLMSIDGDVDEPSRYFPGKDFDGLPAFDQVMEANEADVIGSQDTVLMGRATYDQWSRYWPSATDQPFTRFINAVKKYVMASSPLATSWNNSVQVAGSIDEFVREIKVQPGGDIGIHGSILLAQSLLASRLIDELRLVIGPSYGFHGRRLFARVSDMRRLELLSASAPPNGSVLLAYRIP